MKNLLYILTLALLLSSNAVAQKTATATMKISATIVSGVTLNPVKAMNVDLKTENQTQNAFEFITPEHLDTEVEVTGTVTLENEFGETLVLISESDHRNDNGKHKITLTSTFDSEIKHNASGQYHGNLTTTINYL